MHCKFETFIIIHYSIIPHPPHFPEQSSKPNFIVFKMNRFKRNVEYKYIISIKCILLALQRLCEQCARKCVVLSMPFATLPFLPAAYGSPGSFAFSLAHNSASSSSSSSPAIYVKFPKHRRQIIDIWNGINAKKLLEHNLLFHPKKNFRVFQRSNFVLLLIHLLSSSCLWGCHLGERFSYAWEFYPQHISKIHQKCIRNGIYIIYITWYIHRR